MGGGRERRSGYGIPRRPLRRAVRRRGTGGPATRTPSPTGLEWLSARERARLEAMRFTKRRNEYLLRRWVGKRTVAARVGLDADAASLARIEVLNRVTGAPYVVIEGAAAPWEISLSDRAGCAVAVIGRRRRRVPGDARDRPRDRRATQRGLRHRLPHPRRSRTGSGARRPRTPRLGQDAAANLVWSAKESALKVLRLGLRADTRWVEVTVGSDARGDGWARFTAVWRGGQVIPGGGAGTASTSSPSPPTVDLDPPRVLPGSRRTWHWPSRCTAGSTGRSSPRGSSRGGALERCATCPVRARRRCRAAASTPG